MLNLVARKETAKFEKVNVTATGQITRVLFQKCFVHPLIEPVQLPTRLPMVVFFSWGKLTGVLSVYLDDNFVGIRLYQCEFRRVIFASSPSDVCVAQQDEEGDVCGTEVKCLSNTVS